MITPHTLSMNRRRWIFAMLAVVDVVTRFFSAGVQADSLLFGSTAQITDVISMSAASGVMVPLIAAPLVLSPIAFLLGQVFVETSAHYVRFVSAALFVGSFMLYTLSPLFSLLLAAMAYLVLGSGMMRQH